MGLNYLLDFSGGQFRKVNEAILGRDLYKDGNSGPRSAPSSTMTAVPTLATPPPVVPSPGASPNPTETVKPEDMAFNSGFRVNPYDRFGVAGLTWTGYIGE